MRAREFMREGFLDWFKSDSERQQGKQADFKNEVLPRAKELIGQGMSDADVIKTLTTEFTLRDRYAKQAVDMVHAGLVETATAGATVSGNIATVANPVHAKQKVTKKGKYGAPQAPQKKNKDGTTVNALDDTTSFFGAPIKRQN